MKKVTRAEFARLEGVNKATVTRWVQSGRVTVDSHGLIDPEEGRRQRQASESPMPHHQARKAQFDEAREYQGTSREEIAQPGATSRAASATDPDKISKEDVAHRKNVAVMLEREWMAAQREIEARRAAGDLCEVAKAREAWRSAYVLLRTSLEGLPSRAASELAAHHGDVNAMEHALDKLIADALHDCAATFDHNMGGAA